MTDTRIVDILLVEDDPGDAELTSMALRRKNLVKNLRIVHDGAEALEFLFSGGSSAVSLPRLIILDLKLPKVGGLEVLRKIKSSERTREIPVVMYTSSVEEQDVTNCYSAGANAYVQKPLDFDTIMERVGELGSFWLNHNCTPAHMPVRMPARVRVV